MLRRSVFMLPVVAALALAGDALAQERFITVSSTTSTENSGLFGHILPRFTEATGIEVRVVAVGTGQAIEIARRGDADVLLVHHKPSEEAFVAAGFGLERREVMYNDYVIVGPAADPAGIAGSTDAAAALAGIAAIEAPFASRGDDSGTHKAEVELWQAAGLDPGTGAGDWYRETGSGMGATLNTAIGMEAYVLSDRGTWLSFENKAGHVILVEGDPRLFNQYGVILVSPRRHPHVKAELGQAFIDWLVSAPGQEAIAGFTIGGERAFFPNAAGGES
jgi:tungstate transport system substrate-binding protein